MANQLYAILECKDKPTAILVTNMLGASYVFTGNVKPYLVVGTQEQADKFERIYMKLILNQD
jgi:hypothetical protein